MMSINDLYNDRYAVVCVFVGIIAHVNNNVLDRSWGGP